MTSDAAQLQRGGERAVSELFAECRERLERLIDFRLDPRLSSRIDAQDILQEAYLEVARRINDYIERPEVSFYVWARQITLQTLIDTQRRHFGQKRSPLQEVPLVNNENSSGTCYSIVRAIAANNTTPSRAAMRAEEIRQLHAALATLDEIDREVLALRHFEHLSNKEVAEALGLSVTAASNRYVRAMTRLSEILQKVSV